jgi:hypothetical protein
VDAAAALSRREPVRAREALVAFDALAHPAVPITPDYGYAAARLWAELGDTTAAVRHLDAVLSRVRSADASVFREQGNVASLLRAAVWRGQLAAALGDRGTAQRWQGAIVALQGR